jgi:hypothetical protein
MAPISWWFYIAPLRSISLIFIGIPRSFQLRCYYRYKSSDPEDGNGGEGAEARERAEEAENLWDAARLEALTVYLGSVEKITAKGPKTYEYYFASWKVGDKVVNKYIGSPRKMTREAAAAKAQKLKAEALDLEE